MCVFAHVSVERCTHKAENIHPASSSPHNSSFLPPVYPQRSVQRPRGKDQWEEVKSPIPYSMDNGSGRTWFCGHYIHFCLGAKRITGDNKSLGMQPFAPSPSPSHTSEYMYICVVVFKGCRLFVTQRMQLACTCTCTNEASRWILYMHVHVCTRKAHNFATIDYQCTCIPSLHLDWRSSLAFLRLLTLSVPLFPCKNKTTYVYR